MDRKVNERFVEVLTGLARHEDTPGCGHFARPTSVGAFPGSHHEMTLEELVTQRLVDDGASYWVQGNRKVGLYRITKEGRTWLKENSIPKPRPS